MITKGSINRKLADYAHATAQSLHVPFVTIALADRHCASYVDADWAAGHPEVDLAGFEGPVSADKQSLPFFAAVPIRTESGAPLGYLSCGDSSARDLSDDELGLLKNLATDIATEIATPAFAR